MPVVFLGGKAFCRAIEIMLSVVCCETARLRYRRYAEVLAAQTPRITDQTGIVRIESAVEAMMICAA